MQSGVMQPPPPGGVKMGHLGDAVVLVNVAQVLGCFVDVGVGDGVVPRFSDRVTVMRVWAVVKGLGWS